KNMELMKNHYIYEINDIKDTKDIEKKIAEMPSKNNKVIVNIFNIEQLNHFNSTNFFEQKNVHFFLFCSKQIFQRLDLNDILNKSILKNITLEGSQITLNYYPCQNIDLNILNNNIKVAETINFNNSDFEIKSKIHEVLYHANTILKNFKKQDNQV